MCDTGQDQGTPYVYKPPYEQDYTVPYYKVDVGTKSKRNYRFLEILWDANSNFRSDLLCLAQKSRDDPAQEGLKSRLKDSPLNFQVPENVNIVVIDLETAKMITPAHPQGEFYILMLPANPRGSTEKGYKESQQLAEAWYHAIRETGGM